MTRFLLYSLLISVFCGVAYAQDASDSSDARFGEELGRVRAESAEAKQARLEKSIEESRKTSETLQKELDFDRAVALVHILHLERQYKPDQLDGRVADELEKKQVPGTSYKARELLDPSFTERGAALNKGSYNLDKLRGLDLRRDPQDIQAFHREMTKNLGLAFLEGERYRLKLAQADLKEVKSRDAISATSLDASLKAQIKTEGDRLEDRLRDVMAKVQRLEEEFRGVIPDGLRWASYDAVQDVQTYAGVIGAAASKQDAMVEQAVKDVSLEDYKGARRRLEALQQAR